MLIREYKSGDVAAMVRIWNKVVEDGIAFPQEECLDEESGREFFAAQSYCGVAENDGAVVGLYILHPNYAGRLGHIANASYAVDSGCRGMHIGEKLVLDCLAQTKRLGFGILQFNAVVGIFPAAFRQRGVRSGNNQLQGRSAVHDKLPCGHNDRPRCAV